MKEINIAGILLAKRKEKGVTQDALANYIGVSKASVSKWETGQSYPDITFLPQLAAYFAISIDALLGYEPQMTKEDIATLYRRLAEAFVSAPFEEVLADIGKIVKKYFSCFPLLYHMGALLVNHYMLAEGPQQSAEILMQAKDLFVRVRQESEDVEQAKQALHMEALCLLLLDRPGEVLVLLEGPDANYSATETLFATAYQMLGRMEEAASALQVGIYKQIISTMELLSQYLTLRMEDAESVERIYRHATPIIDAFDLRALHPASALKFYLSAACGFAACGQNEQALDNLEAYVNLATGGIFPLSLHGDDFFDRIDGWLHALGASPPRNDATIKKGIVEALVNPAFDTLATDARFMRLISRLKKGVEEG